MSNPIRFLAVATWLGIGLVALAAQPLRDDLADALEQAMKSAVAKVAASVVQIETSGGTDVVGSGPRGPQIRRGTGPTTGLIVAADGYVISSAFNFANKPSAIFVAVPGHKERFVAKVVATDQTRMLTLLKIDAKGLPVPAAAPKREIRVGQSALALGRTWTSLDGPPSVSIGIVSALGRIWGKAIQTDAKVSPVNYGGPLVDLEGRVLGVLVPASPRGQDETAGVEWYDSGIGFAIPLEDVLTVLPRLKEGKDLKRGIMGITQENTDIYGAPPVIASVAPDSPALRAGLKRGDVIIEINGNPVTRQAQVLHLLGDKYEGDTIALKVKRGKEELTFANLKLSGTVSAHFRAFLGVLPIRDDPEVGEEIRYVFPKSQAEGAGLKSGDRIMAAGVRNVPSLPFAGRDGLTSLLDLLAPGTEIALQVRRKGADKTETIKVTLGALSDDIPERLPEPASHKKALVPHKGTLAAAVQPPDPEAKKEPKEKKPAETGILKRATPSRDHEYTLYVPKDYDPNIAYALVMWLHPAGKGRDDEIERVIAAWQDFCSENHFILLCPKADSESGWLASEADFLQQALRDVMGEYTIDRQRVVAHGMGIGGQMAFYVGFNLRDVIRGVATTGTALTTQPKENVANQRLAFFLVAGGKDPLLQEITDGKTKLLEHKFPVVYREIAEMGHQYLDAETLQELVRWIDSLDRQ